ncbi:MAG: hypothetical protein LBQ61_09040 [Spirochaetales bacterium]|nr:hypothetical protein [Spirochaetales bacterium]
MTRYLIKSSSPYESYLDIIQENQEGFQVLLTREYENGLTRKEEFMGRELFESCLRTGYLQRAAGKEAKTA